MDEQEMASPPSDEAMVNMEAGGEMPLEQLTRTEELPFDIPRD